MAIEYKYPDDITNSEFKNRRIKINIFKPSASSSANEAIRKAKEIVSDFTSISPFDDDNTNTFASNLQKHKDIKILQNGKLDTSIVLPMPSNFQDSQSHGWSTESGIIGTIGTNISNTSVGSIISKLSGGKLSSGIIPGGDITADKALGSISSSLGSRKPIIDPGYFQNYTGSEPRSFTTDFDFIPGSAAEAQSILSIIMKLKQYSSPSRHLGGVGLLAPHYFSFEFSNRFVSDMIKVDRLVLKDISFDYGADGAMQMTGDGIPKYITVSLSWQEVDLTTANDYSHIPNIKESSNA